MIAPTLVAFPGMSITELRSLTLHELRVLWEVKGEAESWQR